MAGKLLRTYHNFLSGNFLPVKDIKKYKKLCEEANKLGNKIIKAIKEGEESLSISQDFSYSDCISEEAINYFGFEYTLKSGLNIERGADWFISIDFKANESAIKKLDNFIEQMDNLEKIEQSKNE